MKFTMTQVMKYDAYIADIKGKRLYTFTEDDKRFIINSLIKKIGDNLSYSDDDKIGVFFEFTTPDGEYIISIDLTFNGDIYYTEDWDTGYKETTVYVKDTDINECYCYPSDVEDVFLYCDTLLDMIENYFTNLTL